MEKPKNIDGIEEKFLKIFWSKIFSGAELSCALTENAIIKAMKIFVFSDLHGSISSLRKVLSIWAQDPPDRIILLGDILNGGYEGGGFVCARELKKYSDKIIAVRGNCDREEDERLLGVSLPDRRDISIFGRSAHLGHRPIWSAFPEGDLVFTGHTHVKTLYEEMGVIYLNPGSIAYPRDSSASYAWITERGIGLYRLDDQTLLQEIKF